MQADNTTRRRERTPADTTLVLTGSPSLTVRRGRLTIEDGTASLGTARTLELEPPLKLQTIILLTSGGGMYSEHALRVLAENGVALYSLKQNGALHYYLLPSAGAIKPGLLRLQANLPDTSEGLTLAKGLLQRKIERQQEVLTWLATRAVLPGLEAHASASLLPLEAVFEAGDMETLRLAEGRAADCYFSAWRGMPVTFEKTDARNVQPPSHWRRFEARTSRKSGDNMDATNPINALLNFGYAVAVGETMIACRAASLEPSFGLLHYDKDGRQSFIYDLMEPLRPIVDRSILELLTRRNFRMNRDFILLRDGVCRIGIEFAAEFGNMMANTLRPEAAKVCAATRAALLSIANVTYRVARREKPATQGTEANQEEIAKPERRSANAITQQSVLPVNSAEQTTPDGRRLASPKGICCVCGVKTGPSARYCPKHRSERFSEQWRTLWAEGKVINGHSEETRRKRNDSHRRTHALKGAGLSASK